MNAFFTLLLSLFIATSALAQSAILPAEVYRDGRYIPLRLEASTAGTVTVFGSNIQPIEWHAPGTSSVVVPLLLFRDEGGGIFINGKETPLKSAPLADTDADPASLTDFWRKIDPMAGGGPPIDQGAYAMADLWQPGRSADVRRTVLLATAIAVLLLGVARHADPKRATRWLTITAVAVALLAAAFVPGEAIRRVLPADGRPGWEYVWYAGSSQTITEPWSPGLRYVSRDIADVMQNTPVLQCDAAGRPTGITVAMPRGGRVVFIRPRLTALPASTSPLQPVSAR